MDMRSVAKSKKNVREKVIAAAVYFCFGCKFAKEQTTTVSNITGKTDVELMVGFVDSGREVAIGE